MRTRARDGRAKESSERDRYRTAATAAHAGESAPENCNPDPTAICPPGHRLLTTARQKISNIAKAAQTGSACWTALSRTSSAVSRSSDFSSDAIEEETLTVAVSELEQESSNRCSSALKCLRSAGRQSLVDGVSKPFVGVQGCTQHSKRSNGFVSPGNRSTSKLT